MTPTLRPPDWRDPAEWTRGELLLVLLIAAGMLLAAPVVWWLEMTY